jgi:hypothetical protein
MNDLVTNSAYLGQAMGALIPSDTHGGSRPCKKRPLESPKVEDTKRL